MIGLYCFFSTRDPWPPKKSNQSFDNSRLHSPHKPPLTGAQNSPIGVNRTHVKSSDNMQGSRSPSPVPSRSSSPVPSRSPSPEPSCSSPEASDQIISIPTATRKKVHTWNVPSNIRSRSLSQPPPSLHSAQDPLVIVIEPEKHVEQSYEGTVVSRTTNSARSRNPSQVPSHSSLEADEKPLLIQTTKRKSDTHTSRWHSFLPHQPEETDEEDDTELQLVNPPPPSPTPTFSIPHRVSRSGMSPSLQNSRPASPPFWQIPQISKPRQVSSPHMPRSSGSIPWAWSETPPSSLPPKRSSTPWGVSRATKPSPFDLSKTHTHLETDFNEDTSLSSEEDTIFSSEEDTIFSNEEDEREGATIYSNRQRPQSHSYGCPHLSMDVHLSNM